eukprot:1819490-Amphidinium_carterae.1
MLLTSANGSLQYLKPWRTMWLLLLAVDSSKMEVESFEVQVAQELGTSWRTEDGQSGGSTTMWEANSVRGSDDDEARHNEDTNEDQGHL